MTKKALELYLICANFHFMALSPYLSAVIVVVVQQATEEMGALHSLAIEQLFPLTRPRP